MSQISISKPPKLFLRASSVISLVFAGGHTFGTLNIVNGEFKDALLAQNVTIEGIEKTFSSIFLGYGHIITVFLILQSLILWILSSSGSSDTRTLVSLLAIASAFNAALSAMYLIFIPALFLAVITLCLVGAWITLSSEKHNP